MTPQDTAPKGWNGMKRRIEKLTKAVDALRTITIQRSGTSDSVSMGQNGITINLREIKTPKAGAVQNAGQIHAFQLVQSGALLYVRKGTINSIVPTISATALADDYLDNALALPGASTTREYWLKATLNASGTVTAVTIETTEPSADSATQSKLMLGSVTTDGSSDIDTFNSNLSGSQSLASCGATHYFGVI